MLMTNFLKDRESIRDFRRKKIGYDTLEKINLEIDKLEKEFANDNFKIKVYENGEIIQEGLEGKAGYSGVMIESPHYIVLNLGNEDDESMLKGAYAMEKLTTALHKLDIATCWITLTDVDEEDKKSTFGEDFSNASHMLAIGYSKLRNPFVKESFSSRKSIDELVYQDEIGGEVEIDDLENRGLLDLFYYVRYAPSTKNLQPWRFLLRGNKVILLLEEENKNYTDAGIIMYYFEYLASLINRKSEWKLLGGKTESGYIEIAEIEI